MVITALVPMRHISTRVPGKNYRHFAGKPLYKYIINTLLNCPLIDKVVVDTDSPKVKTGLSKEVLIIDRPPHLCYSGIPTNSVLLHDVSKLDGDYFLQTHCTNPLLTVRTLTIAIRAFKDQHLTFDSLFSVTPTQVRFWDSLVRPINHNKDLLLPTQMLAPIYEENSCIYIFSREVLETTHNRIGSRPLMFVMDEIEAWDIDTELDFRVAEFLLKERERNEGISNGSIYTGGNRILSW